mmetsp:Transcript_54852/g.169073  ORF Transcript_54852/g.169073 Transcript_54852/m.169073 type:complete len:404 (-) Transcript_54852:16-1227(-)
MEKAQDGEGGEAEHHLLRVHDEVQRGIALEHAAEARHDARQDERRHGWEHRQQGLRREPHRDHRDEVDLLHQLVPARDKQVAERHVEQPHEDLVARRAAEREDVRTSEGVGRRGTAAVGADDDAHVGELEVRRGVEGEIEEGEAPLEHVAPAVRPRRAVHAVVDAEEAHDGAHADRLPDQEQELQAVRQEPAVARDAVHVALGEDDGGDLDRGAEEHVHDEACFMIEEVLEARDVAVAEGGRNAQGGADADERDEREAGAALRRAGSVVVVLVAVRGAAGAALEAAVESHELHVRDDEGRRGERERDAPDGALGHVVADDGADRWPVLGVEEPVAERHLADGVERRGAVRLDELVEVAARRDDKRAPERQGAEQAEGNGEVPCGHHNGARRRAAARGDHRNSQ